MQVMPSEKFKSALRFCCIRVGVLICSISSVWADSLQLPYTLRDFSSIHPDFEQGVLGDDHGIVQSSLGADKTPVYAGGAGTATTSGKASFDQWYHDVSGANLSSRGLITLDNTITSNPNVFTFDKPYFFPIDDVLLGNEGRSHNYHFTYELHSKFTYQGGESLTYTSDDDLWVFVNDTLIVDLGGIHPAQTKVVDLDAVATTLGITPGNQYDFDLFFAERQTTQSALRFDIPFQVLRKPENGDGAPAKGLIRVFLVFAEVDFQPCGRPNVEAENWPAGELPTFKDALLDHSLSPMGPSGVITDYFHKMSFGSYLVLGDYYPQLVSFDCASLPTFNDVVNEINSIGDPIVTAHGLSLDDFDLWEIRPIDRGGATKGAIPDNYIDIIMVAWRNYNPLTGKECVSFGGDCATGYIAGQKYVPLGSKSGFNNFSQFVEFGGDTSGIFLHEYMHLLFGGNNWHIGGGAGSHSIHVPQGAFGMMAQSPAVSNVATGWDRNHLDWQHPNRQHLIGALENTQEVATDMSIISHPHGGTFILRDFVTFGDSLRIKLPHINWHKLGDTKNQYLWLENHQRLSDLDVNARVDHSCVKKWSPGIYAYVQIGKDTKAQDVNNDGRVDFSDIYSTMNQYPNALGSYLFPLTAEGNFDFYYRLDYVEGFSPSDMQACQWNNVSVPIDKSLSLSNPFTGYSDVFQRVDIDNVAYLPDSGHAIATPRAPTLIPFANGRLFSGEPKYVLTELVGGSVVRELPEAGDQQDAFGFGTGKTKLTISTNPAPVPVYTNTSAYSFGRPSALTGSSYENRTIWLNGLSIEVLEEKYLDSTADAGKAVIVQVRWDNYRVDSDVRWTGNIVLQNDVADPLGRKSRIILSEGKNIYLDRGLSPTQDVANTASETVSFPRGSGLIYPSGLTTESKRLFTAPTHLTVKSGTKLHLKRNATLWLLNGSTLEVEAGAEVQLEPGARIEIGPGGGYKIIHGVERQFGDFSDPPDGCVDRGDLSIILNAIRTHNENVFYDLNEDFDVDMADARYLVTLFTNSRGESCL